MTTALAVGRGPNGLASEVRLARSVLDVTLLQARQTVSRGTRSSEMIAPGLLHDHCSAIHPVAAGSPFFSEIDLESLGVRWLQPSLGCAHPLDEPVDFKVDFAVEGGVPWTSDSAREAGTVHLGGGFDEWAATEPAIHRGHMPEKPFVLVGQQYLADPQRSVGDVHPA